MATFFESNLFSNWPKFCLFFGHLRVIPSPRLAIWQLAPPPSAFTGSPHLRQKVPHLSYHWLRSAPAPCRFSLRAALWCPFHSAGKAALHLAPSEWVRSRAPPLSFGLTGWKTIFPCESGTLHTKTIRSQVCHPVQINTNYPESHPNRY